MNTPTWTNLFPTPDTWKDVFDTFGQDITWNKILNSYIVVYPSLEVVNESYNYGGEISNIGDKDYLPTIVVYDTIRLTGGSDDYSSENTNILRLLNQGNHMNLKWLQRYFIVLPDDTYISSQTMPGELTWDDNYIYMQLGKSGLWGDYGEGYHRVRFLAQFEGSFIPFFFGFLRIKVIIGHELI